MAAPKPLTGHRVKLPPDTCTPRPWFSPQKPSAAVKPSAEEKGDPGASPDYGNPTRTHAEEGQAERSEKREFGGLPRLRQAN
jgi:hypothetical protein